MYNFMKFTLSWLKTFLETDASSNQIINTLNNIGLEVEEVIDLGEVYQAFLVAEIISTKPHPEAEKLQICQVNNGSEVLQIVCGAKNARPGIKVVLAPISTIIPANNLKIKESKIRNISSFGMLCSAQELKLSEDSDGIIELPLDSIVGESFAKHANLQDIIIEISITPNRGDCLGVYGIARDLAAAGIGKLKEISSNVLQGDFDSPINVKISSDSCLKYVGRYFRNVSNKESPKWLKDLLQSIGQKSISSLVDISNYFTFAFGRPMHIFDADKISDLEIRDAIEGEEFLALNDKKYILYSKDLIATSENKLLALSGIIGGKECSVCQETKNIFLEIALFEADQIAKTARSHQIESDAKYRFERKLDANFMETALNLASEMIINLCAGQASKEIVITKDIASSKEILFPLSSTKKRLGIDYDKSRVISILSILGFNVKDQNDCLHLTVPSWRHDINNNDDIVEEIARIDGYNNIQAIALQDIPNPLKNLDLKQRSIYKLQRFAASLGLDEVVTWSFMHSQKASLFSEVKEELFLKNPISSKLDYMRPSVIPNLLEAALKNQNRGLQNIALFELGSAFKGIASNDQILLLSGIRSGMNNERNLYEAPREVDVFDVKSDVLEIIAEMGIESNKLQYLVTNLPKYYHPGRSGAVMLGKTVLAFFGEVHPSIIKAYELKANVVAFEVLIDNIPLAKPKFGRKTAASYSDYQSVERDFAFIVNEEINLDKIIRTIEQIDKKLIKAVKVFDIYRGKNIEQGKKSIALTVVLQANDKTLSESEIDDIHNKIVEHMLKTTNASLRKD
jgi:phenylalanyl-tRNA synthetase beta chain